ncbi:XTP/dITP diphosphatase [Clostridium sp. Cult1]|uniref:XTP/dITP diphosphatase n=1 Tax=Clostridium sp. Cult1 TaxID=2079002 RepID=UPI001F030622|nr:XTP/dITP diphosphatase [Clostridium sp. Cult1]MCF6463003.1 non-canonical purine NTP pyrophosphatase [Clostridium sp. Cult1]
MTKRRLVLSTGNIHKVEEIKKILEDLPLEVVSKNDLGLAEIEIEENGKTLEENAIKKAISLAEKLENIVIADDSGLFVEYLNEEPGVHSARYSGTNATDEKNNIKLLYRLDGVPMEKRRALFKTVIALVTEKKDIITVTGECRGYIGFEPKGKGGFGYDPLFVVEGYDRTFAELGEEIKNKISHRAKALEKLKEEITKILEDD